MPPSATPTRPRPYRLLLACTLLAVPLLAFAQHLRLPEQGWFSLQQWLHADDWRQRSLWLGDYQASIQGLPIAGLDDDLSALTYDPLRRSLFSVTNSNPHVIELGLDGRLLRSIPLHGFGDPEAIEYIAPGVFVISDEREQRLVKVHIDADTQTLHAADGQQLSLGIGRNGNKGFEGLAYDSQQHRLFVAKERNPTRIYQVSGFPHIDAGSPLAVHIADDAAHSGRLFLRDLSSLQYHAGSGHLLALSDESRLILELDVNGQPISSLSLRAGEHGLQQHVPQAEGVAMDEDGTLYLVSEPNLFYVFRKPAQEG